MSPLLAALGLLVLAGAVLAVSVPDPRLSILGLAVSLLVSPLLADPFPAPLPLAARLLGAILAVWLPWLVLRDAERATASTPFGWPAEALFAATAAVVGYEAHGLGLAPRGPAAATAAGLALAVLAVAPLVSGRDTFRLGIGLALLVDAATLLRAALDGTPGPLEQLITSLLFVALMGGLAALASAARGAPAVDAFRVEAHRARDHAGTDAASASPSTRS